MFNDNTISVFIKNYNYKYIIKIIKKSIRTFNIIKNILEIMNNDLIIILDNYGGL